MMPLRPTPAALLLAAVSIIAAHGQSEKAWLGTWATANMPLQASPAQRLPIGQRDVTLRQVVHISQGGKRLRITFTNEFGTTPLHIAAAHLAFLSAGSTILAATDHVLTFSGHPDITIAPGAFAASDALSETIPIYSDLVISTAIPQQALPTITYHSRAYTTTFIAPGDQSAAEDFNPPGTPPPGLTQPAVAAPLPAQPGKKSSVEPARPPQVAHGNGALLVQSTSWYFLKDVEVNADPKSAAVVTFGDSITDGEHSTPETNRRYPDALAALLGANKKTASLSVLNVGISGNRILHEGTGPDALDRFNRDVASQTRARFVILLEGINDIGHNVKSPVQLVTAANIIEGMKTIVERAHAKGLTVFAATLLPCGGSGYGTPEVEAMRQQINTFILTGNAFDGVIDFDKALHDPNHIDRILPKYDSGDHLHPSDAGYAAMATAVDMKLFQKKR